MNKWIYLDFLNSKRKSLFYDSSKIFSSGKKSIGIINQYDGKHPLIMNEKVIQEESIDINFNPILLLDSNIVEALNGYVTGKGTQSIDQIVVIEKFLNHVCKKKCDYNPTFYLTENFAKSPTPIFIKTASEKVKSIFKLHTMDEDVYVKERKIQPNPIAVNDLLRNHNASSLGEAASNLVLNFSNDLSKNQHYEEAIIRTYVCLLKTVLIHFKNPKITRNNVIEKYHEFKSFLLNELNLLMAREVSFALNLFSGNLVSMINIQSRMLTFPPKIEP